MKKKAEIKKYDANILENIGRDGDFYSLNGGTIYLNILSTSIKNARMINASSARTGDLYMLNTANVQTIFEKSKKKQLFYVMHEDIW